MSDFAFLKNPYSLRWVIMAPKRAKRPDQAEGIEPECPFEPGHEEAIFSLNQVRVLSNKYPFAPIHEVIVHSDDHQKNFGDLSLAQNQDILKVYRQRFNEHKSKGQVYIFHNQGKNAGESLPHPHTQLVVIPHDVELDIPKVRAFEDFVYEQKFFNIFCPLASQWPDEVWIAPKKMGKFFGDIVDEEITDFAHALSRIIQLLTIRHGEFPFNFYISPSESWCLRIVPRLKTIGGFEIGTGVYVNTQSPEDTLKFIKEHFENPDFEKIKSEQTATYKRSV